MPDNFEAQYIRDRGHIGRLLRRLLDEHTLLSVSFVDDTALYSSTVLAIDSNEGWLNLDELAPRRGHEQVRAGSKLRIEGRLQGVETRFVVTVQEIGISKGIYYYRAAFPDTLVHHQRRQFHRVPVKLTLQNSVSFAGDASRALKARLTDLSAGGLGGMVIDRGVLTEGGEYICTLELTGGEPITARVEIRFARTNHRGQQRFGAMFLDLSPQDQRRVERMVMELERAQRRTT